MPRKRRVRATSTCPQCGGAFPAGRPACPHCGSDAETGWTGDTSDFAADEDADYEETIAQIQGRDELDTPKWRGRRQLVVVTGLVIVFLFVFWLIVAGSSNW